MPTTRSQNRRRRRSHFDKEIIVYAELLEDRVLSTSSAESGASWCIDFVAVCLEHGTPATILVVTDFATTECLYLKAVETCSDCFTVRALDNLIEYKGSPNSCVVDPLVEACPELLDWSRRHLIRLVFCRQSLAFAMKHLAKKLEDELLNIHKFRTTDVLNYVISDWRRNFNLSANVSIGRQSRSRIGARSGSL